MILQQVCQSSIKAREQHYRKWIMHFLPAQALLDQAPVEIVHEATAIAREINGFPLALEQTGAYLEKLDGDVSASLALYKKQRAQELNKHEQTGNTHHEAMAETHAFTFEQLKDTPHLDLLHLLSFLYPDALPEGLLVQGAQALQEPLQSLAAHPLLLHQALGELRHASLVRYHADRAVLQIQRIVQDLVIESLSVEQQRHWAEQAVRLVNHAFPEVRFDTQALCERYLPQAQHCATLITRFHLSLKEGALLLERLGSFCVRHASYDEAETYLTQALHLYEHHLQTDILDTAQTLNSLGRLYHRRAHYTKSEISHQRALQLREQTVGFDHPKTAESLHNLALLHGDLGQYQEAEYLYQRVLSIEERLKGTDHPDVADTLNNLGLTYAQQGRYTEAEKAYRRTLAIYKASRGAKHPDLAYPLNGLGSLAEKRGNNRQAEKLYQQAFALYLLIPAPRHPDVARVPKKYSLLLERMGRSDEATALRKIAETPEEKSSAEQSQS